MNIEIKNASANDRDQLYRFFLHTITHTFHKNGINDPGGLESEIQNKMTMFDSSDDVLFLAKIEGRIIGTIAYGSMNEWVRANVPDELQGLKEIKSVYIDPEYQNRGIGTLLWGKMLDYLTNSHIEEVCLDSGYKISQLYWKKKIGEPTFFLKDFWGKGDHQLIWVFQVDQIEKKIT
jgi:GNAT superfamily N-acetyltransferase